MTPLHAPSVGLLSSLCRVSRIPALSTGHSVHHLLCRSARASTYSITYTKGACSPNSGQHRSQEQCNHTYQARILRNFTTSHTRAAEIPNRDTETPPTVTQNDTAAQSPKESALSQLGSLSRSIGLDTGSNDMTARRTLEEFTDAYQQHGEHHLYVYAHKHNTHMTLTGPQYPDPKTNRMRQDIMLTLSCGNIGYRKSQRSTFDAAYQLGSYFMSRIRNDGLLMKIQRLELVLRGFGNGREAITKLMLGQEGSILRDRVVRVVDSSRIKFGGQRAPRPRRLG